MRDETRAQIEALKLRRQQFVEQLVENPSGLAWCADHTQIADEVVHLLYRDAMEDFPTYPELAVIATGGFGRRELCVRSDIDITIVPGDETSVEVDAAIRRLFQEIHWAFSTLMRLDVGYAYRLVSDASGLDAKTRTGLMDMRLLAGSEALFRRLREALDATFPVGEFVLAKIQERRQMYARFNDTPLVIEPQLKEGAGGLRDFHCASWIGQAIGQLPPRVSEPYDLIVRCRNLLHYCSGKSQDLLGRSRQAEIAGLLGTTPNRLVAAVSEAGQTLHSSLWATTDKLKDARFTLSPGVISNRGEVRILPDCSLGSAAIAIAVATKLGLSVSDLPAATGNSYAGPGALFAISAGETTLRNLDRCSLLGQLLPELVACRFLAGGDSAHRFTVMEHSLRVVRNLDSADSPGLIADLRATVIDAEPLYLAALLHDIGKIDPNSDHAESGAKLASEICERWELDPATGELVTWLVSEHLTMARFLRIRDIAHPATILEFAQIVQEPERLKLLTLLTWADVSAVAEGSWTMAQDAFLRILHDRTLAHLQGESVTSPEAGRSRLRLLKEIKRESNEAEDVEGFLESLPAYYLTSTNAELVKFHLALAKRAVAGSPTIEHHSLSDLGATEITTCSLDRHGLLSQILGVLYSQDLSLLGLRACTTSTEPAVAIDVFTVSFGGRPVPAATMGQTADLLRQVVAGTRTAEELLVAKSKDPTLKQQVTGWTFLPGTPAILEIRTPRGRGMPYRFSQMFAKSGWNILAARVGQWAGTGAAAFYLVGPRGAELTRAECEQLLVQTTESSLAP